MSKHTIPFLALPLAALLACTVQKIDDSDSGASSEGTTDSSGTGSTGGTGGTGSTGGTDGTGGTTAGSATEGGTTINPTTGNATGGEDGGSPCIDTPLVLAPDDDTPLGVTAEKFLADKVGPRETTLTIASEPLTLSDAWKGKELPLHIELRYEGGEIRWIDSEPDPDWDDSGNESGPAFECIDRLEIDVGFDFVTEAGEFNEHRDAILSATTADRAELVADLIPPGLTGLLDLATVYGDPEWVITDLQITGTWEGTLAGGSVMNEVLVGGDDGFAGFGPLASWGDVIEFP